MKHVLMIIALIAAWIYAGCRAYLHALKKKRRRAQHKVGGSD